MALSNYSGGSGGWSPNQNPRAGMNQVPYWNANPNNAPGTPAPGPVAPPPSSPTSSTTSVPFTGAYAPPPNPMDGISAWVRGQYAPQLDAIRQQAQLGSNLGSMRDAYYGNLTGLLQQGYQNDLGKLGVQQNLNSYDLGAARANLPLLDQLAQFTRDQTGLQGQQTGLLQQIADMQKGYHGLNTADLWSNLAKIASQEKQQSQQAHSAGVAGGFGMAPGVTTGLTQIKQAAAGETQAAHNAYQTRELGLNVQDVGNQRELLGSQREALGLQADQVRQQMQRNLSEAQISSLEEKAKGYGMDANSLYLGLQKSLAGMGLDRFTNANDVLKMLLSSNAQEAAIGNQIIQETLQQAGSVNPLDIQRWNQDNDPRLKQERLDNLQPIGPGGIF